MSDSPKSGPEIPPYFKVPKHAHFSFRKDFIEELCFSAAMARLTPKEEKSHRFYLGVTGLPEKSFPLAAFQAGDKRGYVPTQRYILQRVAPPNASYVVALITDGQRRSGIVEMAGLFDFAFLRAVELAVLHGIDKVTACGRFSPGGEPNCGNTRRLARWGIGYEPETGLCTILFQGEPDSVGRFLKGRHDFWIPKFKVPNL